MESVTRVLITGATGFIGRYVTKLALREGFDVFVLIRDYKRAKEALGEMAKKCTVIKCDLTRKQLWKKFPKKIDVVFHLAALLPKIEEPPYDLLLANAFGTLNLLTVCHRFNVKRVILSSSISVFGDPKYLPIDEKHPKSPSNFYAFSKFLAEHICELEFFDFERIVLRYSSVYGPFQRNMGIIRLFLRDAISSGKITIFGRGEETRDFVHVYDVARANIHAAGAKLKKTCGDFNIGSGTETSIDSLAKLVAHITKAKINYDLSKEKLRFRLIFDITKAKRQLDYSSTVPLEEGISDFYHFMKTGKTKFF